MQPKTLRADLDLAQLIRRGIFQTLYFARYQCQFDTSAERDHDPLDTTVIARRCCPDTLPRLRLAS
ncbi:MAG: hypothetical protein ACR2Q4_02720 [Geminicoccaceae bacterium]